MCKTEWPRRDAQEFINRSKHKKCISSVQQSNENSIKFSLSTQTRSSSKTSQSKFLQDFYLGLQPNLNPLLILSEVNTMLSVRSLCSLSPTVCISITVSSLVCVLQYTILSSSSSLVYSLLYSFPPIVYSTLYFLPPILSLIFCSAVFSDFSWISSNF